MKRLAAVVAMVVALGAGTVAMANATQNRPDPVVAGSQTTVEFTVATNRYARGDHVAAAALWAVCSATVSGDVSPAPVAVGDGIWQVTITPAIGHHGEDRLVGCFEDHTLDRVLASVVSLRSTTSPPPTS